MPKEAEERAFISILLSQECFVSLTLLGKSQTKKSRVTQITLKNEKGRLLHFQPGAGPKSLTDISKSVVWIKHPKDGRGQ